MNFSNVDGLSPLHICAELGRSRLSRLLCEASGDVDLVDVGGSFDQISVDVCHGDIHFVEGTIFLVDFHRVLGW